jgi:pimeloyl-ACP methyl ester carboxylesterase
VRARYPDSEGFVERHGVRTFFELYGDGERTVFMLPTWSLLHSRCWKGQVPYLARHFRVLCCDPRGNGRSDRPADPEDYREEEFAADALAVMDATETDEAVLVAVSLGVERSLLLAANHPARVAGIVQIAPAVPLPPAAPRANAEEAFKQPLDAYRGWEKWNANYWRRNYPDFVEFFVGQIFTEPHSTKQREDAVGWALETDSETLIATQLAPRLPDEASVRGLLARVRCPMVVLQGRDDAVRPYEAGAAFARLAGAPLVTLEGSGHGPQARIPVKVNLLIREFVESLDRAPRPTAAAAA